MIVTAQVDQQLHTKYVSKTDVAIAEVYVDLIF